MLAHMDFDSNLFMEPRSTPNNPLKTADQVRDRIHVKHYSLQTEKQYIQWINR